MLLRLATAIPIVCFHLEILLHVQPFSNMIKFAYKVFSKHIVLQKAVNPMITYELFWNTCFVFVTNCAIILRKSSIFCLFFTKYKFDFVVSVPGYLTQKLTTCNYQ